MKNASAKQSDLRILLVYALLLLFGIACIIMILLLGTRDRALYSGTDTKRCIDRTQGNSTIIDTNCNCFIHNNTKTPRRGDVYDDRNRVLASDINIYDITLDGRSLKQSKNYKTSEAEQDSLIDEIAKSFYRIFKDNFSYDLEDYRTKIERYYKNGGNVQVISSIMNDTKRWIRDKHIDSLKTNPYFREASAIGLNITKHIARYNPYGNLARRTIGRKINDKWDGLEHDFNEYLHGIDGAKKLVTINTITIPMINEVAPREGDNIQTTINLEIQNIAHHELLKTLRENHARWGCAVVMETQTGEIKAISNLTALDTARIYYDEIRNYAVHSLEEPGSTFKLASLLAYLERKKGDDNKQYPILAHQFVVKTSTGREATYSKYDEPGKTKQMAYPIEAFQRSSNVGIASMVFDTHENFQDYLTAIDKMSITNGFKTQLGDVKPVEIRRNDKNFHNYYNVCFGTGIKMTPMQTLIYYNAVANNGKMVAPLFVKNVTMGENILESFSAEVLNPQICSPITIAIAQEYLLSVVQGEYGTARRYKDRVSFAGKTGTRDIWDESTNRYNKGKNSVSFCGYFPAEEPKYTCIVFIYDVKKKSSIAIETFVNIAERIMNVFDYELLSEIDKSKGKKPMTFNTMASENAKTILQNMGYKIQGEEWNAPYLYAQKGKLYPIDPEDTDQRVPDVRNLNVADAVYILNNADYKVKVMGRGIVRKQDLIPNSNVVELTLSP